MAVAKRTTNRKTMFRTVHLMVLAVLAVACVSRAPTMEALAGDVELAEKIDSLLSVAVQDGFGGAVIIEREGRILLSKVFGFANRQERMPSLDTIAPIGSITKSFTALALVQLAAEGKVDLQRPLKSYLPNAIEPGASARISDVLAHQAGLLPNIRLIDLVRARPNKTLSR